VVLAIIGWLVWAGTDADANTCRNALVGALDPGQCSSVTFWHDVGAFGFWAGAVTFGICLVLAFRRQR
jgi:hypothetical protein